MAQQTKHMTAVEWLIEQLIEQDRQLNPNSFTIQIYFEASKNIIEQAKQMEKEQTVDAYGGVVVDDNGNIMTGEQYYNETYKTQAQ